MHDAREIVRQRLGEIGVDPDSVASLVDEIVQHVEDRYRASRSAGLDDAAARERALHELDGCEMFAAEYRTESVPRAAIAADGSAGWAAAFAQDVRYAWRTLRRSPLFTLTAVLTVALSTGPTFTALGFANFVFLRPPAGVHEPHRVGVMWFGNWVEGGFSPSRISYAHLADVASAAPSIAALAGELQTSVNLAPDASGAGPRIVSAQFVTANFFDALGATMAEGRGFVRDDDRDFNGTATVIGHTLARSLFHDGSAIGRIIRINDHRFTVVGVARRGFEGTETGSPVSLWLPGLSLARVTHLPESLWAYGVDRGPFYSFVLRLRPGATFARADAELRAAASALGDRMTPETSRFRSIAPQLFPDLGIDPLTRPAMAQFSRVLIGIGLVFVALGIANLANLFLFRGARRLQEAAVRRAVGASAGRLIQVQLLEGLMVACGGAVLGLVVTVAARSFIDDMLVPGVGRLRIEIDWRVAAAATVLAACVGAGLGAAPARLAVRGGLVGLLASGSRTGSRPGTRLRMGLAVLQFALSLALLIGGLLYVETLRLIGQVDLGLDIRRVSTFSFAMRGQAYTSERTRLFYRALIDSLAATPGFDAVSAAALPPLAGTMGARVLPPDVAASTTLSATQQMQAALRVISNDVTPAYFRTFGMRFVAGRSFSEAETHLGGDEPAVIISASLARQLYGTTNAVGRLLAWPAQGGRPRHDTPVVGVVNDVRWRDPRQPVEHVVYRPFSAEVPSSFLMVRSSRSFEETRKLVSAAAATLDPALPVASELTMTALVDRRLAQQRILAWLLGVLAALGFLLAGIGIYGLVSQSVIERVREFGIRLAIGAAPAEIVRLVLRQALVIVAVGTPAGLLAAAWFARTMQGQLFGVAPLDPIVYLVAVAALIAVAAVAVIAPSRRALRVNPVDVMRVE